MSKGKLFFFSTISGDQNKTCQDTLLIQKSTIQDPEKTGKANTEWVLTQVSCPRSLSGAGSHGWEWKVQFHFSLPFQIHISRQKTSAWNTSLNCDLWICFWFPVGCLSILSQGQNVLLSCLLYFVFRGLGLAHQIGGPKIWPGRTVTRVLLTVASSLGKLSKSSCLLVIFESGSGSWYYLLHRLWGRILYPWDCSILPGIFTFVPSEAWQGIWKDFFFFK